MTATVDLTEAQLQAHVLELAQMFGYKRAHFRPALTKHGWRTPVAADGKGFPDLVLLRPGRIIFAEIKTAAGRLTRDQHEWLDAAQDAGAETYVWRPADLQHIAEILR